MYNFVIFGSNWDLYKVSYSDLNRLENVRYISTPYEFRSPVFKFLYRLHWSPKINRFVNLPFKKIWNSGYFKNDFFDDNPICFIFFSSKCVYEKDGLLKYLRIKYHNSKMVCFSQDIIDSQQNFDIYHLKDVFDLVISFDQFDCIKYGLEYHQLVYSHFPIGNSSSISKNDVYFLGRAKNRLDEIIKTYEYLKSKNLKCDFHLVGVESKNQVYPKEINYIDNMPYIENLKHVVSSKCLLEIMQQNGHGYTQRMCEAIAYGKKIITNNVEVKGAPFYNEKYISVYSNLTDIDISFLKDGSNDKVNYNYKEKLSPKELISFIENKLLKK